MNTLLFLTLFNLPALQGDYRCDLNVEINNLCNMPYILWLLEPNYYVDWRLA